jgi:hypothetical protein
MTVNKGSGKQGTGEEKRKTFETVHEVMSHFFPEGDSGSSHPSGNKRGSEVAERVFTEVTHSSHK